MSDSPDAGGRVTLAWTERAACRDEDPELFFPVSLKAAGAAQAAEAKEVCARCPVHEQCRDYALRTHQDAGIWGGLTEEERLMIRRRKSRVRSGTGGPLRAAGRDESRLVEGVDGEDADEERIEGA